MDVGLLLFLYQKLKTCIIISNVIGKYSLECTGVTTTVLHDELHCDPAHLTVFAVAEDEPSPPSVVLLVAAMTSSGDADAASSLMPRAAESTVAAAAAEAADVLLLAGALSSRCAKARLSVDGAGGLVIIISSSSSEWTRSLTIPDVVLEEVDEMTETRWSQSHLQEMQYNNESFHSHSH